MTEFAKPIQGGETESVRPLIAELCRPVRLVHVLPDEPGRDLLERFVQRVFQRSYGAHVRDFHPHLLGFTDPRGIQAVVGWRAAGVERLFCEQYLDQPVENWCGQGIAGTGDRASIVEVGNLAVREPGQARWLIAAMTAYLYRAGFRQVVFTAVRPLFNAFHRMGLQPLVVAPADPARLADAGRSWGNYYEQSPLVCRGDIASGYRFLQGSIGRRQPNLRRLWLEACEMGLLGAATEGYSLTAGGVR